jgi:hypothetical protein
MLAMPLVYIPQLLSVDRPFQGVERQDRHYLPLRTSFDLCTKHPDRLALPSGIGLLVSSFYLEFRWDSPRFLASLSVQANIQAASESLKNY